MSIAESQHRAHKARLERIASRAVPQAETVRAAPRILVRAAAPRPLHVIDRDYERAWAAAILGWTPKDDRSRAKPRIEDIQRATARQFGLTKDELLAVDRAIAAARPRHVAMFLARELTMKSCAEIGSCFAGRDHTAVIHAVKRIRRLLARAPELSESVDRIRRALDYL